MINRDFLIAALLAGILFCGNSDGRAEQNAGTSGDSSSATQQLMEMLVEMGAEGITPGPELTPKAQWLVQQLLACQSVSAAPTSAAAYQAVTRMHRLGMRLSECPGTIAAESSASAAPAGQPPAKLTEPHEDPIEPPEHAAPERTAAPTGPGAPPTSPRALSVEVVRLYAPPPLDRSALASDDVVYRLERIDCIRKLSAFLLIQEGIIEDATATTFSIRLTKRYAARFTSSGEGINATEWTCKPERRYCFGPVSFSDFDSSWQTGDIVQVPHKEVWPQERGKVEFIAHAVGTACQ